MKAQQMFEKLGYRCIKSDRSIWYINDSDEENYRSVEFYFCDCTFDAIGNYGDPLMVNVKELEAINKQCEEIGWLEEEKKTETNLEHYLEYLSKLNMSDFALIDGRVVQCLGTHCRGCDFNGDCIEGKFRWLKQPYKKPTYKLTKFEYDLLNAHQSMKQIEELGRLCYQNNIEKKDIFLMDQIIKRNMSAEVQYLLDHKLSVYELEYAYRAKGYLG